MNRVRVHFTDSEQHWLVVDDGQIVARGVGESVQESQVDEIKALIFSADCVAIHRIEQPELAPAQARAAARLQLAEQSLLAPDDIHLICGDWDGESRLALMVSRALMVETIDRLDPDIILPSPLLLPEPEVGFLRADLPGETVIRGLSNGFKDDVVITPLIVGDGLLTSIDRLELESSIISAVSFPRFNLREGEFAKRRQWQVDKGWVKRMAVAVAALILVTISVPLVKIIRLSLASSTLEQSTASLAQAAIGEPVAAETAVPALDAKLTAIRGGGGGFLKTSTAALRAVQSTANVEVMALAFDGSGTLRLTLRASNAAELSTVQARMRAAGLEVRAGQINPSQGQPITQTEVRGR